MHYVGSHCSRLLLIFRSLEKFWLIRRENVYLEVPSLICIYLWPLPMLHWTTLRAERRIGKSNYDLFWYLISLNRRKIDFISPKKVYIIMIAWSETKEKQNWSAKCNVIETRMSLPGSKHFINHPLHVNQFVSEERLEIVAMTNAIMYSLITRHFTSSYLLSLTERERRTSSLAHLLYHA